MMFADVGPDEPRGAQVARHRANGAVRRDLHEVDRVDQVDGAVRRRRHPANVAEAAAREQALVLHDRVVLAVGPVVVPGGVAYEGVVRAELALRAVNRLYATIGRAAPDVVIPLVDRLSLVPEVLAVQIA